MNAAVETALTTGAKRQVIIRPSRGLFDLDLGSVWQYRELLHTLMMRDIQVLYKQAALGAAWAIIQPIFAVTVFTIVFGTMEFGRMVLDYDMATPRYLKEWRSAFERAVTSHPDAYERLLAGGEGEPLADGTFAGGVDVGGVSDIGGDGHGGVLDLREREKLRLTDFRRLAVERGDLHEEEREIALFPLGAPLFDHVGEKLGIFPSAAGVGFTLIPERPFQTKGNHRIDHAVEQRDQSALRAL